MDLVWQELMQSNNVAPFNSRSYSVQHNSNRMDSKLVYPAVFLLFCLIHSGSSLRCYMCNTFNNESCGDPFFVQDDYEYKTAKEGSLLKECPSDIDQPFCRKIYQNVRGEVRVIRGCGSVRDEKERDCYTTVLEEYNTKVCQCDNDDGCNSGNMFRVSILAIVSATLLAYIIQ